MVVMDSGLSLFELRNDDAVDDLVDRRWKAGG